MRIDIVFDPVCPWCYIGKRRLEKALALRPQVTAALGWRPFLLNPELPVEGIDRTAFLIRKFGSEARIRRLYGAISSAGQSVEIEFAFDRIRHTPNSVNAHRLVRFAARWDKAGDAVEALFFDYFINGKNTGEIGVLLNIGVNMGLDEGALHTYLAGDEDVELIYEENARAHRLGLNGVPTYVFNDQHVISGAQEPQILARMLDVAHAAEAAA
ncbi:MAG: DsbA family oxidoreductase [Rhodospirillales bacterium]|nr:DsbA family oxidoreductase [Rhodospirillales bacterium]